MKKTILTLSAFALPFMASAQTYRSGFASNATGLIQYISEIINYLVPFVSTLAVVYFFYGLAKYVLASGDEEKAKEGKSIMIWGVLAMFVIVTVWGIIAFLQTTIGNNQAAITGTIVTPSVGAGTVGGGGYAP